MIKKSDEYNFNQKELCYVPESKSLAKVFKTVLSKFAIASLFSLIILLVFFLFISPFEFIQKTQSEKIAQSISEAYSNLDSLQLILEQQLFSNDQKYREILELENLPTRVRYAGTGGNDPYQYLRESNYGELTANTMTKLEALKKQVEFQKESFEIIHLELNKRKLEFSSIPAIMPVKPTKQIWVSSYFGTRKDPFTFARKRHAGIDFVGPVDTKIFATADGFVTLAKHSRRGYGNEVVIEHEFGYSSRYAHLNEILVEEGERVKRGQLIGLMGNSGRSTGTHLHYEVRKKNRATNPINYFSDDLLEEEYDLITKCDD